MLGVWQKFDNFGTETCNTFQFKDNHFTEMCSGSEAGSYLRLIDLCISQL